MFRKKIRLEYDNKYNSRVDDKHLLKYYQPDEFKDINHKPIAFESNGNILRGNLFFEKNKDYNNIIIFVHGAGAGYLAYMKEIYTLVKGGYQVLSYDTEATFSSEGENVRGFSQPLANILDAINYVQSEPKLKDLDIYLIGHSWGGFTVLNAINYKIDKIKKVVALAPLISAKEAFKMNVKGLKRLVAIPELMKYEEEKFGNIANFNAFDSLNSDVDILVVASEDDPVVSTKNNFMKLKEANKKENHQFLLVNGRLHNPNYTKDAANYLAFKLAEFQKLIKEEKLVTYEEMKKYCDSIDYERATQQDKDVFSKIFKFLGGK